MQQQPFFNNFLDGSIDEKEQQEIMAINQNIVLKTNNDVHLASETEVLPREKRKQGKYQIELKNFKVINQKKNKMLSQAKKSLMSRHGMEDLRSTMAGTLQAGQRKQASSSNHFQSTPMTYREDLVTQMQSTLQPDMQAFRFSMLMSTRENSKKHFKSVMQKSSQQNSSQKIYRLASS